jgi:DNA invertase Pin-like site-specific DNA recombinase
MLIGYARVSTINQSLDRQIASLRAAGCDRIFREKASGKDLVGRPQLAKAIDSLGTGDVLVVAEWDRATRSLQDGHRIIQQVSERGALLKVLDRAYLDLTTDMGQALMGIFSAMAADERRRILARTAEGRKAALAKPPHLRPKFGPRHKLSPHQRSLIREAKAVGATTRELARQYSVSQATISRIQ